MGEEKAAAQGKAHQGVCEVIAPDDLERYFHLIILNKWFRLKTRTVFPSEKGSGGNGLRLVSQVSELALSASLEVPESLVWGFAFISYGAGSTALDRAAQRLAKPLLRRFCGGAFAYLGKYRSCS